MAKVTFSEGVTDFKVPEGSLIFYTGNGKTFVRVNPGFGSLCLWKEHPRFTVYPYQ